MTKPFPNSQKVHVETAHGKIRVAMREVTQAQTKDFQGQMHDNPPLRVYDTSGPYTDPAIKIDFRSGLKPIRAEWIEQRGDTETYAGREVQRARQRLPHRRPRRVRQPARDQGPAPAVPRPETRATSCRRGRECLADVLCQEGHHHAGDGIHCHPRNAWPPNSGREVRPDRPPPSAPWHRLRPAHQQKHDHHA